ncbi:hypothetical protein LX64_01212 [Chitinophaga skermanii]|uniref:Uncharacterized protein n=1 Tax=Chitinophaga skermanii TaxID=331697 RepID=A0A327QVB7_9BACT|nr:hypothetical protein [Chitinophaga skermanii]RAJ08559.1 hypothetical protein LX64_01212 [Chitinophaga skermanii]
MPATFTIHQFATNHEVRPPISYLVRKYFEEFIQTNLLQDKKLQVPHEVAIVLDLYFVEDVVGGPKEIFLSPIIPNKKNQPKKPYMMLVPLGLLKNAQDPQSKTMELMYEAIMLLCVNIFPKLPPNYMANLGKKIDWNYLKSLPYPAPQAEQQYVSDLLD